MGSKPLFCDPFKSRMLSVVVAPGYRQETLEYKIASEIAHDSLCLPGHQKRTI